jgi:hypothetical protein
MHLKLINQCGVQIYFYVKIWIYYYYYMKKLNEHKYTYQFH